jgi:hypothetical protein
MSENLCEQDEWYPDKATCDAISGDRHESIKLWEQVASGDFDNEVKYWLESIAAGVLDAESKPAGRLRDGAIIRAVGLAGNVDKHRSLRDFVGALRDFEVNRKQIITCARSGQPPRGILIYCDYDPSDYQNTDDADFAKIIDRELSKSET